MWRAFLILVVPIIFIQIVVGYVFTDRFYRGVTVQLTSGLALDVNLVLKNVESSETLLYAKDAAQRAAQPLEIQTRWIREDDELATDQIRFYDISGKQLARTLKSSVSSIKTVDLISNFRLVKISAQTKHGMLYLMVDRRRASASNPHQVLVVMILASILMTTIGFFFMKNQVRPITRLAKASEAFGKGRSVEFRAQGATEVWAAGHAFLAMRKRIDSHIEQRTLMLSGVSHDLRTPLTRMKLSLSMMEEHEDTEFLKRDVEDMEAMLDSFMAFAKGEGGEKPETISAKVLSKDIVRARKRADERVELSFLGAAEDEAEITCYPAALRRAIDNLISNALRHGETVQMNVKIGRKWVEFRVEDDGPGIPKDRREAALRPFNRLDESRNQNKGGAAGLGLSITSDVAGSHGGQLSLTHSAALGGLRATLRIPR
jgi:two-component system osmolarity sensor histidine kinase EnvZ